MISSIRKLVCCARKPRSPACSVKLQPQHIGEASTRASDAPPCPMLNDVPLEILQLIFPLIPFLSQVCLALTCKPLYRLLGHVLKDDRLAWPRALAMKTYEVPLNQPDHLRNQLLLLLEDDRWLYCSWCLKLHPHALFLRLDCGKDSPPSLHRTCIHSAGVVDLCPCLSLTFFDRIRLEEWLQTGLADTITRSPRVHQAFQLSVLDGQRYLLHQCSITDHKYAFVRIFMKIILDEDGLLVVRTRYYVRMCMNTPQPDPRVLASLLIPPRYVEPVFMCPDFDILTFIRDPRLWTSNTCHVCPATAYIISCANDGGYVLQCTRSLGRMEEPKYYAWNRGSRKRPDSYLRVWYKLNSNGGKT